MPPTGDLPTGGGSEVWTIVVAGGSGQRFGRRKQFAAVGSERMIDLAARAARQAGHRIVRVVPADDVESERASAPADEMVVAGGETRAGSVRAGLAGVGPEARVICVHDAARPMASVALFDRVVAAIDGGADAAVPGLAVVDTIKVVDDERGDPPVVVSTPPRQRLVAVQTPQAFAASVLRRAHEAGADATDDAALVEAIGARVVVVPGEADNRKVTVADDLDWAGRVMAERERS